MVLRNQNMKIQLFCKPFFSYLSEREDLFLQVEDDSETGLIKGAMRLRPQPPLMNARIVVGKD